MILRFFQSQMHHVKNINHRRHRNIGQKPCKALNGTFRIPLVAGATKPKQATGYNGFAAKPGRKTDQTNRKES